MGYISVPGKSAGFYIWTDLMPPGKERGKGRTGRVKGENQAVTRRSLSPGLLVVAAAIRARGQDGSRARGMDNRPPFFSPCRAWEHRLPVDMAFNFNR